MEAVHEIDYPAIARAQQLSAERLGVRSSERASRWDITRPHQPSAGDNCNGDTGTENPEGSLGRRQEVTVENVAAAMRSSLSPPAPATARRVARGGDLRRDKRDKDKSLSPLPPRHARPAQRTVLVDITQILRSVREEAVALDRFLSLEVEPVAQHIFDAAVSEHARACRLLAGPPVAADFGIDPASSNSSTPTTATNTTNDDEDTGGVAAAAAAARRCPPDAGRRVLKAQGMKHPPPPEMSLRASLSVRAGTAVGTTAGAFSRRPSTAPVGRGAAAAAGGSGGDKSRLSLPGRRCRYPTSETVGRPPGRNQQGGGAGAGLQRKALVATADAGGDGRCNGRAGDGGAGAGGRREAGADDAGCRKFCVDKEEEEEEEGEEGEGEWQALRLPGGKLATDISSKMVGLSSLIRKKAAAASGEASRNDHHDRRQHVLR